MNKKINLIEAIESIYPNTGTYENPHKLNFYLPDPYDYSSLQWNCDLAKPSEEEVLAEVTKLQAAYDANSYQRIRYHEYPEIKEQLDMIWHAMDADPTKRLEPFYTTIKTIKDNNPKPE